MMDRRLLSWPVHAVCATLPLVAVVSALGASPPPPARVGSVLESAPTSIVFQDEYEASVLPEDVSFAPPGDFAPGCDTCSHGPACNDCIRFYDAWGRVDYLLWWRKSADLPPLVSTGILNGTNSVLFGGDGVGGDSKSGGRVELGLWFDPCHYRGVVGRFFALGEEEIVFDSTGRPNVARPFIDVTPNSPAFGMENALVINAPGGPTGSVNVRMTADVLGGDVFFRRALCQTACSRLDFLIGYQMARIDENLTITQQFESGGVTISGVDVFDTTNEFHGVELGLMASRRDCRWSLDVLAKVGLGSMDETVTISGSETRQPPPTTTTGSFLALPTNIGRFNQNQFAAVPELGVNLTYELNECLDFNVGYSFIYWSHVLRPGDAIDRTINGTQTSGGTLTGQSRPQFAFVDGDYWVQGVNFGLTLRR